MTNTDIDNRHVKKQMWTEGSAIIVLSSFLVPFCPFHLSFMGLVWWSLPLALLPVLPTLIFTLANLAKVWVVSCITYPDNAGDWRLRWWTMSWQTPSTSQSAECDTTHDLPSTEPHLTLVRTETRLLQPTVLFRLSISSRLSSLARRRLLSLSVRLLGLYNLIVSDIIDNECCTLQTLHS